MGIDFNQLRYESHTLARRDVTELPQKPFVAKDLTARTRQNYQLQDTTFERSRQPSARSYKSRSV